MWKEIYLYKKKNKAATQFTIVRYKNNNSKIKNKKKGRERGGEREKGNIAPW